MKLREIEFVQTDRENSYEVFVGDFRAGYFTYMPMLDSYMFNPSFEDFFDLQRVSYKSKDEFSSTLSEYTRNKYYKLDLFRNRLFDDKKEVFFEEIYIDEFRSNLISLNNKGNRLSWIGKNFKIEKENGKINVHFEKVYRVFTLSMDTNIADVDFLYDDDEYDKSLIFHRPLNKFLYKISFGLIKLNSYLPKNTEIKRLSLKDYTFSPKFLTINGETF